MYGERIKKNAYLKVCFEGRGGVFFSQNRSKVKSRVFRKPDVFSSGSQNPRDRSHTRTICLIDKQYEQ